MTVLAKDALEHLRKTAKAIGEENLGFLPQETRAHSTRSGAAMDIFLDNAPTFLIMLIVRWKSDGFLKHMIKKVLETSKGMSTRMLKNDLHHALRALSSTINDPGIRNIESFDTYLSSMALT